MVRKCAGTDTRPLASILFTALDKNRSITRYASFPRPTPVLADLRARGRVYGSLLLRFEARPPRPDSPYGRRFCEHFSPNCNECLSVFVGYHGAIWASTG